MKPKDGHRLLGNSLSAFQGTFQCCYMLGSSRISFSQKSGACRLSGEQADLIPNQQIVFKL